MEKKHSKYSIRSSAMVLRSNKKLYRDDPRDHALFGHTVTHPTALWKELNARYRKRAKEYRRQVKESDGFDIDERAEPPRSKFGARDEINIPKSRYKDYPLVEFSQLALHRFNDQHPTKHLPHYYQFRSLAYATHGGFCCGSGVFKITFYATKEKKRSDGQEEEESPSRKRSRAAADVVLFQARVDRDYRGELKKVPRVQFCRIKG